MKRFKKVIALTPYERELYLQKGLKEERVVLLPHAIDYGYFSRKPETDPRDIKGRYGISRDDFVITSVSNFRKFKNLDTIVAAFGLFCRRIKNAKLMIVGANQLNNPKYAEQGEGRYSDARDPEEVIKEYGIKDNVIFTGGVDFSQVRDILSISDVFVNNSNPETMGISVYEAASHGVPLCLPDIPSFRTVFGDSVLYSTPRDENGLADRFMQYFGSVKIREENWGKVKELMKKWDYEMFMEKLDKLYNGVLS